MPDDIFSFESRLNLALKTGRELPQEYKQPPLFDENNSPLRPAVPLTEKPAGGGGTIPRSDETQSQTLAAPCTKPTPGITSQEQSLQDYVHETYELEWTAR